MTNDTELVKRIDAAINLANLAEQNRMCHVSLTFLKDIKSRIEELEARVAELEKECNQFSSTWDIQQAEIKQLKGMLDRLGSNEAFDVARSFNHPQDDELIARMEYARTRGQQR